MYIYNILRFDFVMKLKELQSQHDDSTVLEKLEKYLAIISCKHKQDFYSNHVRCQHENI